MENYINPYIVLSIIPITYVTSLNLTVTGSIYKSGGEINMDTILAGGILLGGATVVVGNTLIKNKGKKAIFSALGILVIIAGLILSPTFAGMTGGKPLTAAPTGDTGGNTGNNVVNPALITDNSGTVSFSVLNELNTTTKQYLAKTVRLYKVVNGKESQDLFTSATTITTGTGRGTATIDKYNAQGLPQVYNYYVAAVDNSSTSAKGSFVAAESVEVPIKVQNQANVQFKVYDEEARAYLQESTELSAAGALFTTGNTWYSSTSNSTGKAIGVGDFVHYTIYAQTTSTIARFNDQRLLIAVDAQDLSDWQVPTITVPGATVTLLAPGQYNDKIKNGGYDFVFEVSGVNLDSRYMKIDFMDYAKPGVNPTDSLSVGLYTAGEFVHTLDDGMGMDTHQDDSSQTAVFTPQVLTLSIS